MSAALRFPCVLLAFASITLRGYLDSSTTHALCTKFGMSGFLDNATSHLTSSPSLEKQMVKTVIELICNKHQRLGQPRTKS